jgi:RNA polymerase sigma-70 factor, ECF subfamily
MFRERWGRVVAMLIAVTGDWDLAEECAQEAFAIALDRWRRDGVPGQPGPWLMATARNAAIDRVRRSANGAGKLREVAVLTPIDGAADPDDRLALIFTCCHPALALESRVALTLRTLGGLSTAEIARAFMVAEPTMAQRLVRAKRKIAHAAIPYRVPAPDELGERTSGVLGVLYLLFNEGYSASAGADLMRQGLCAEAIHLARVLSRLMPTEGEVQGLAALLLLQDARRAGRTTAAGDVIVLEDQDRSRWDREAIAEGLELLRAARRHGPPGPYALQAAIAAQHAIAPTASATDWAAIAALYDELAAVLPTPVVALNRAVAVAMADGPADGLALIDELDAGGALAGYHLLPAARADLLRRLGHHADAAVSYRDALALAPTDAERRYLARRLEELAAS